MAAGSESAATREPISRAATDAAFQVGDTVRHVDGWRTETGKIERFRDDRALVRWSNEPVSTWCRLSFLRRAEGLS